MLFKKSYLPQMRNMTHFGFHSENQEALRYESPIKLGVADFFIEYVESIEELDVILKIITSSKYTALLRDKDIERDISFSLIRDTSKAQTKHFVPEMSEAARSLTLLFKNYGDINRKPYNEQTSNIHNLVQELQGEYKAQVALLRLKDHVDELLRLNNEFKELMNSRQNEYERLNVGDAKEARKKVDDLYKKQLIIIEANYINLGEENYKSYVAKHNIIVDKYRKEMKSSRPRPKTEEEILAFQSEKAEKAEKRDRIRQLRAEKREIDKEIAQIKLSMSF